MGESSFWYRPTRVVPDQRPLNGRCCCCLFVMNVIRVCGILGNVRGFCHCDGDMHYVSGKNLKKKLIVANFSFVAVTVINIKNYGLSIMLTATDQKPQKSLKR